jgi:hypothetical protein
MKSILKWGMIVIGFGLVVFALGAYEFGIDHNPEFGPRRWGMLFIGGLILLLVFGQSWFRYLKLRMHEQKPAWISSPMGKWYLSFRETVEKTLQLLTRMIAPISKKFRSIQSSVFDPIIKIPIIQNILLTRERQAWTIFAIFLLFVAVIYLWLISVGFWFDWPESTAYFDLLADAFAQGQVHLLIEPGEDLLSLSNPYNLNARADTTYIWDTALFQGKFYLYWGPVPALLLMPAKLLVSGPIEDKALVFLFSLGAFFFSSNVLMQLWLKRFRHLPAWTFGLGVLTAGLVTPMPWLLNRPDVYEVAIAGGQFFLIGGMAFLLASIGRTRPAQLCFALAGLFLASAVGSRASLAPASLIIILGALGWIWGMRNSWGASDSMQAAVFLVAPYLVGAAGLAWYNFARFGSLLEFGHRYVLTGINLYDNYDAVFSVANIPPNLINYLINPFRSIPTFPFIKANWGTFFRAPAVYYYTEMVTGIFISFPVLWFSILAVIPGLKTIRRWMNSGGKVEEGKTVSQLTRTIDVLALILALVMIVEFMPVLLFYLPSMRYLADVVPTGVVLSMLGCWMGYESISKLPLGRRAFSFLVWTTILFTIGTGFLLAVSGYAFRFEKHNLELFESIGRFLAW